MNPPLRTRCDSRNVRLGPKSYQWTRALLSDRNKTAPTRFDLFNARKQYDAIFTAERRSHLKCQHIHHMCTILKRCLRFYWKQIGDRRHDTMSKINGLVQSRLMTRSMNAKINKLESEFSAIFDELFEKSEMMSDVVKFDDLGELPELLEEEVDMLNDRILAARKIRDQVLEYLES